MPASLRFCSWNAQGHIDLDTRLRVVGHLIERHNMYTTKFVTFNSVMENTGLVLSLTK